MGQEMVRMLNKLGEWESTLSGCPDRGWKVVVLLQETADQTKTANKSI